jgi:hypothetical protein
MMDKLGYIAAGLMVAGMITLAPASALAGCGACGAKEKAACGAKEKAACAEECVKACCTKDGASDEKTACDADCQKACCTKE